MLPIVIHLLHHHLQIATFRKLWSYRTVKVAVVLPLNMVDNSTSLCKPTSGWIFVIKQSGQTTSSRGEALSEFFCWPFTDFLAT